MKAFALYLLAAFFVGGGIMHFMNPGFYLPMMPPYLPLHLELVYLSGVAEIVGGVGVLVPRWRSAAGFWVIAVLVAVFPANLHMALNMISPPGLEASQMALWLRLPMQGVFILWAWWATRPD
jgi:uncharacterized membrane protein